jgi:beta-glucanase (GH16 family)
MTCKRILRIVAVTSLAACSALSACSRPSLIVPTPAQSGRASAPPIPGYRLAWHDEFDGGALDPSTWTAQNIARRDAVNTAAAVSVADGVLTLTTYTEGGRHYTGFVDTAGKYEPTFGYLEARIRFDTTSGEWGAFWLQSPTMGTAIGNPAVAGTEIDIVEHRASDGSGTDISNSYVINLHWDGYGASHRTAGATGRPAAGAVPLQGNWHIYALLWTADQYVFYLDGAEQWRSATGVSKRGEYLRLTCEVLDKGWAGSIPSQGYGTREASATRMLVDWVRVWQPASAHPIAYSPTGR